MSSSSEDEEEERKERDAWCRKPSYTSTACILGFIVVASCYTSAQAFGTALCKCCMDVMGARTWRERFFAMDEEGTLTRARFLSAGTLGLFTTVAYAATAYIAGVNPTLAATGGVASTAALYLSARLSAGGLFASEGKNYRGPVYEKARRRWKLLFPNNTFPFITAALLQTLACLALGTPALRAELPLSLIPMANCKPVSASSSDAFKLMLELDQNRASTYTHRWGWVTMRLLEVGLLGNMFFIICGIAFGAFQGAAEQTARRRLGHDAGHLLVLADALALLWWPLCVVDGGVRGLRSRRQEGDQRIKRVDGRAAGGVGRGSAAVRRRRRFAAQISAGRGRGGLVLCGNQPVN